MAIKWFWNKDDTKNIESKKGSSKSDASDNELPESLKRRMSPELTQSLGIDIKNNKITEEGRTMGQETEEHLSVFADAYHQEEKEKVDQDVPSVAVSKKSDIPAGFVKDDLTGLYFHSNSGIYYDPSLEKYLKPSSDATSINEGNSTIFIHDDKTGLLYDTKTGLYYDYLTDKFFEVDFEEEESNENQNTNSSNLIVEQNNNNQSQQYALTQSAPSSPFDGKYFSVLDIARFNLIYSGDWETEALNKLNKFLTNLNTTIAKEIANAVDETDYGFLKEKQLERDFLKRLIEEVAKNKKEKQQQQISKDKADKKTSKPKATKKTKTDTKKKATGDTT